MEEQYFVNSFSRGLDRDSSVTKYDNEHYYHAENLRILTNEGLTSGSLENIRGNLRLFTLPTDIEYLTASGDYRYFNFQYTGYEWIRKNLVITATVLRKTTADKVTYLYTKYKDIVFYLEEADLQNAIDNNKVIDLGAYLSYSGLDLTCSKYYWESYTSYNYPTVAYFGDMGFNMLSSSSTSTCLPMIIEGRWENDNTQKIYFSDGVGAERQLNLVYNATTNDLKTLSVDKTALIPNLEMVGPIINSINSGGQLKAGMIQYAYQLLNPSGATSIISPCSKMIHLSEVSDGVSDVSYYGSDIGTVVNKSVSVKISLASTSTGTIRLLAIFYEAVSVDPQIRIVGELGAKVGDTYFIDSGQSIGTLTWEEFVTYPQNFALATMAVKFNVFYGANTTDDSYDPDYDARAFRFDQYLDSANPVCYLKESTSRSAYDSSNVLRSGIWGLKLVHSNQRAYFLDASGYELSGSPYVTWANIPEDWDLLPYNFSASQYDNDVFNVTAPNVLYKYYPSNLGNHLYGGMGHNVSYVIDRPSTITLVDNMTTSLADEYAVPNVTSNNSNYGGNTIAKSFQADEVYRFAVVLFDEKGRPSFPKWIGDIRMPSCGETIGEGYMDGYYVAPSVSGGTMIKSSLGVTFTLGSLPSTTKYVQIVVVPRTQSDKSIKTQGVLSSALKNAGGNLEIGDSGSWASGIIPQSFPCYNGDGNPSVYDSTLVNNNLGYAFFYSPDISFGNSVSLTTSGKVRVAYSCASHIKRYGSPPQNLESIYIMDDFPATSIRLDKVLPYNRTNASQTIKLTHSDKESALSFTSSVDGNYDENLISGGIGVSSDGGNIIVPYYATLGYPHTSLRSQAKMPKCYVLKTTSATSLGVWSCYGTTSTNQTQPYYHVVNYIEDVFNSQYGGYTYSDRQLNSYIQCGAPVAVSALAAKATARYGDVFCVMADILFAVDDLILANDRRFCSFLFTPLESQYNNTLRNDFNYQRNRNVSNYTWITQELAGTYTTEGGDTLVQTKDYYKYNTAYSLNPTVRSYIAEPVGYNPVLTHDTRVVASNVKTNGETEDSWTKFGAADYIELDSKYGQLTKLLNFKGQLYGIQDNAICLISTQERELLNTENAGNLVLGTGSLLQRYDYLRTNSGTAYPLSVVATDDGVYWYDDTNREFMTMISGDGVASITEISGLSSFIANLDITSVIGVWNIRFNEIIWTISGTDSNDASVSYTFAYNELLKCFSSFYSFLPQHYIKYDNTFLSCETSASASGTGIKFYRHNASSHYCDWYKYDPDGGVNALGRVDKSKLTLIVNPQQIMVDRFDICEFLTYVDNSIDGEVQHTWTRIKVSNDYQDSGWITLYPRKNIVRRNRKWRMNSMRSLYNNLGTLTKDYSRFNAPYIKVELEYTNDGSNHLKVYDCATKYFVKEATK